MGIILGMLLGLAAGAVACKAMPGPDSAGWIGSLLLGAVGGFAGGLTGVLFTEATLPALDCQTVFAGAIGALFVSISCRGYSQRLQT